MSDYALDLIIDPGHGGTDPGAVSGTVREKDIALEISLYQLQRAKELGIKAGITRRTDQSLSLEEHAARVTISRARICLCNHINAGNGSGAEVIRSLREKSTLADFVLNELKAAGAGSRGVKTKESRKYPGKDYYRMHYTGITETVITEYGFIDNPENLKLLLAKKIAFAEAALKGACMYLGITYTLPGVAKPKPQPPVDPNAVTIIAGGKTFSGRLENGKTIGVIADVAQALGHKPSWDGQARKVTIV